MCVHKQYICYLSPEIIYVSTTSFLEINHIWITLWEAWLVSLRLDRFRTFKLLWHLRKCWMLWQFLVVESWRLHCWPPLALISSRESGTASRCSWSKCNRELLVVWFCTPPTPWMIVIWWMMGSLIAWQWGKYIQILAGQEEVMT